jgi:L-threonylcarbamoyladenylate synthase
MGPASQTNSHMTARTLDQVEKAVNILRSGGVVAMPTDTLYALSAAARDAMAVQRVFDIKGREPGKPLLLFVSDMAMAEEIGVFNDNARRLAGHFWPGQLTIVVDKRPDFVSEALSGGSTVGLRVPDNEIARAVIAGAKDALTGTSANLAGGPDPISAEEVRRQLGVRVDLILDAGTTAHGIASTIVDCTAGEPVVLREGVISKDRVLAVLEAQG